MRALCLGTAAAARFEKASDYEAAAARLEVASGVEAGVAGVEEPVVAADVREEAAGAVEGESVAGGGNEDGSFRPLLDFGPGAGAQDVSRPR
jgi:hypothetical protein